MNEHQSLAAARMIELMLTGLIVGLAFGFTLGYLVALLTKDLP